MKRASRRQQPEMNTLWFTEGITAAPIATVARPIGRTSDGGSEGTAQPNPESNRWLPAEVCESE